MYSYAFAFYMKKNNQMHIFEDNQHDLEVAVEGLSDYLDRRISSERLPDITIKVRDSVLQNQVNKIINIVILNFVFTRRFMTKPATVKVEGKFCSSMYVKAMKWDGGA